MKLKEHKYYFDNDKIWYRYYTNENENIEGKGIAYNNEGELIKTDYFSDGHRITKDEYLLNKIKRILK